MKDGFYFFSTPSVKNDFYRRFLEQYKTAEPVWTGVDWAKDSGMNRGDVIKRDGNITYVLFKTVSV